ncbi:D-aminoacylase [bacterium]|nr:D-aminoacylase [bacterium]
MKKPITRRDFLRKTSQITAAAGLSGCGILLKGCTSKKDLDVIIKNGLIYDGIHDEPFPGDVGIQGEFVKEVGKISASQGKQVIDAKNLSVCPGFIDPHNHTDVELLVNPKAESCVRQGITTLISGNCGSSPFPVADEVFEKTKENLKEQYDIELDWRDIRGFLSRIEEKGTALNYSTLLGHGDLRGAVMGYDDRPPKPEELKKMKSMIEKNMKNGALGLSTGLEYAPGSYASPQEIAELCRVVARFKGVYATHMRSEGDELLKALDETIGVSQKSGVSVQISHLKVAYPRNWDKIDAALSKIENAHREGVNLYCDRYPYTAGSTGLSFYFPLWAKQGTTDEFLARLKDPTLESKLRAHVAEQRKKLGSWDKVVISSVVSEKNKKFEGKSVLQGAKETDKDPYEFMRDLLIEEENRVGMVTFMMKEKNLKRILAHPLVGVGTDGTALAPYGLLGEGKPHPRSYGTFPRVLGQYVREEKILPLPEMIKKMTSRAAQKFGFEKRGRLKKGCFADVVAFDEKRVRDKAIWTHPHQYPEGIEYVMVNGQMVVEREKHRGKLPGRVLRKQEKG